MELIFQVSADPKRVFDHLSDMELFVGVHPLIERMEPIGENTFRVHERVQLGPIPYRFRYKATVTADANNARVTIVANVMGLTHITMLFKLETISTGTRIVEDLEVRSVLPIEHYMHRLFKEQHSILFRNIDQATR